MHYHVVEFINGCLNDYDSGPYEDLEDARIHLSELVEYGKDNVYGTYEPDGVDRFVQGLHILKIEECNETECLEEDHGF